MTAKGIGMFGGEARTLIEKAQRFNDSLDDTVGTTPVRELGSIQQLRTALAALDCALRIKDWDIVAQGAAMLIDLHDQMETRP